MGRGAICALLFGVYKMQSSLDYLNTQIANREYVSSGEIVTTSKLTFANGFSIIGSSIRDITGFDIVEAQKAADDNALSKLEAGVDFLLTKAI